MAKSILIGESNQQLREAVCRALRGRGFRVRSTRDGRRVTGMLRRERYDVVVLDLQMPGFDGDKLLATNAASGRACPIIAVTDESDIYAAVAALRGGVYEYLTKPYDIEHLVWLLQQALEEPLARDEARIRLDGPAEDGATRPLYGFSRAMQTVFRTLARTARSTVPVLMLGEAGTGKEMVARVLHHTGQRSGAPFVVFRPAAVPPEDVDALLFGPADDGGGVGPGAMQQAEGGTLLIDEITRLTIDQQVRLMLLLKGRLRDRREGEPEPPDVRLVASSRFDLAARVQDGTMSSDFYWFVGAVTVRIPPLRERREDILPLARWFIAQIARSTGAEEKVLAPEALRWLREHAWPGNVRELESVLVRGMSLASGMVIGPDDLAGPSRRLDDGIDGAPQESFEDLLLNRLRPVVRAFAPRPDGSDLYHLVVETTEKALITLALERTRGNQLATARLLGINRNTLRRKIRDLAVPAHLVKGRSA